MRCFELLKGLQPKGVTRPAAAENSAEYARGALHRNATLTGVGAKMKKRTFKGNFKNLRLMRLPRTWVRKLVVPALITLAVSALTAAAAFIFAFVEKVRVTRLE